MTALEEAAIKLHDHIWEYAGGNDEWPLQISGDDAELDEVIRLLNALQKEIKKSGYAQIEYSMQ